MQAEQIQDLYNNNSKNLLEKGMGGVDNKIRYGKQTHTCITQPNDYDKSLARK